MAGFIYAIKSDESAPKNHNAPSIAAALDSCNLTHLHGAQFSIATEKFDGKPHWFYLPFGYGEGAKNARPLVTQSQVWRRFEKYAIGMNTGDLQPKPQDLARRTQYWTQPLRLGDGQSWRVPVVPIDAQGALYNTDLPQEFDVDESGKPIMRIADFYAPLVPLVRKYWDYKKVIEPLGKDLTIIYEKEASLLKSYQGTTDDIQKQSIAAEIVEVGRQRDQISESINQIGPSEEERALDCVMVLSRNYHVSAVEVAMLKLLDTQFISAIIFYAFLDKAAISLQELAEKKG